MELKSAGAFTGENLSWERKISPQYYNSGVIFKSYFYNLFVVENIVSINFANFR